MERERERETAHSLYVDAASIEKILARQHRHEMRRSKKQNKNVINLIHSVLARNLNKTSF